MCLKRASCSVDRTMGVRSTSVLIGAFGRCVRGVVVLFSTALVSACSLKKTVCHLFCSLA